MSSFELRHSLTSRDLMAVITKETSEDYKGRHSPEGFFGEMRVKETYYSVILKKILEGKPMKNLSLTITKMPG